MSIPFAVASLGRGLGLVLTGMAERRPGRWLSSARMMSLVVLLALVAGTLRWTNSWDYPPFLLLGIAGLVAFLWARMLRRREMAAAVRQFVLIAIGLVVATGLLIAVAQSFDSFLPISIKDLSVGDFMENLTSVRHPPEQALRSFPVPLLPFA